MQGSNSEQQQGKKHGPAARRRTGQQPQSALRPADRSRGGGGPYGTDSCCCRLGESHKHGTSRLAHGQQRAIMRRRRPHCSPKCNSDGHTRIRHQGQPANASSCHGADRTPLYGGASASEPELCLALWQCLGIHRIDGSAS